VNGEDSSPYLDGEPLIRPFLARRPDGSTRPVLPDAPLRGQVRPYLMTGGRTAAARVDVAMETIVVVSDLARVSPLEHVTFERASILADCEQPRSVAEVAARLGLPLMVGLVLVGDLVGEGLLDASTTAPSQADDVAFLERLIHGVTAL
jgi:hypothetical protein